MGGGKRHKQKVKKVSESDRIFKRIMGADKFPICFGKYPDCPPEVGGREASSFKEEEIPRSCKLCPYFKW
jgi:hypothetical protein